LTLPGLSPRTARVPYTTLFRSNARPARLDITALKFYVGGRTLNLEKLTTKSRQALLDARQAAIQHNHGSIAPIHLALALMGQTRSEEHTSELQSRENLVCRLPR